MSKRSSSTEQNDNVKKQKMLYRHNLATLKKDGSYRDGEDPYDLTLRNELKKMGPVETNLSSSRLLATSAWQPHEATFHIHEFELTNKVPSYSLSNYVRRYEESPTIGDTLTEEQLRIAFKFNETPRSERPYEMTPFSELWNEKYARLFEALNDSEDEEQQRSKSQAEWFNDGGVDLFPPIGKYNGKYKDFGKTYLYPIVTKSLWEMKFKHVPSTDIEFYNKKQNKVKLQLNPFQKKITKPNDGTEHGIQEVVFPTNIVSDALLTTAGETHVAKNDETPAQIAAQYSGVSIDELLDANNHLAGLKSDTKLVLGTKLFVGNQTTARKPFFVVAPFEKGATVLHVIAGDIIFQATAGTEVKLCGAAGTDDENTFQAYFNADYASATYNSTTKTLHLSQSNQKFNADGSVADEDEVDFTGTFNGTKGDTFTMSYNKIVLRNYFYNSDLDTEEMKSKKITR